MIILIIKPRTINESGLKTVKTNTILKQNQLRSDLENGPEKIRALIVLGQLKKKLWKHSPVDRFMFAQHFSLSRTFNVFFY